MNHTNTLKRGSSLLITALFALALFAGIGGLLPTQASAAAVSEVYVGNILGTTSYTGNVDESAPTGKGFKLVWNSGSPTLTLYSHYNTNGGSAPIFTDGDSGTLTIEIPAGNTVTVTGKSGVGTSSTQGSGIGVPNGVHLSFTGGGTLTAGGATTGIGDFGIIGTNITVTGPNVTGNSTDSGSSGTRARGLLTLNSGSLTGNGVDGGSTGSTGVVTAGITVLGGTLTGNGGDLTGDSFAYSGAGIECGGPYTQTAGSVVGIAGDATGGSTNMANAGLVVVGAFIIEGGNLFATGGSHKVGGVDGNAIQSDDTIKLSGGAIQANGNISGTTAVTIEPEASVNCTGTVSPTPKNSSGDVVKATTATIPGNESFLHTVYWEDTQGVLHNFYTYELLPANSQPCYWAPDGWTLHMVQLYDSNAYIVSYNGLIPAGESGTLRLRYDPNVNDSSITLPQSIKPGEDFTITATALAPPNGPYFTDVYIIPKVASVNPTANFALQADGTYAATLAIPKPGTYTLTVTYEYQEWEPDNAGVWGWQTITDLPPDVQESLVRTLQFTVGDPGADGTTNPPAPGDSSTPFLWVSLLGVSALAIAAVFLIRRRRQAAR